MTFGYRNRWIWTILALGLASTANAQCGDTASSAPLFKWWDIYYYYNGVLLSSTALQQAANAWNNLTGGTIQVNPRDYYYDIAITDDFSITGYAEQQVFNESDNTLCFNRRDNSCGICYNSSMAGFATVKMNPYNIQETATGYGILLDAVTAQVMSHELGHIYGLNDYYYGVTNCSYTTVMYYNGSGDWTCHIYTPQPYCDGGNFSNEYSGVVTVDWGSCSGCNQVGVC
jgi:hypothetical protein